MKLLLMLSLLFFNNPVKPPDTSKQKAPKKQATAPKPPAKNRQSLAPVFPSVLIVDIF